MIERSSQPEIAGDLSPHIRDVVSENRWHQIERQTVGRDIERDLPVGGESRPGDAGEGEIDGDRSFSNHEWRFAGAHRFSTAAESLVRVLDVAVDLGDRSAVVYQFRGAERPCETRIFE